MRIVYVHGQAIPSRTANSIQVMQSCEAFASIGHEVILVAPTTERRPINEILDWYGVGGFAIRFLPIPACPQPLQPYIRTLKIVSQVMRVEADLIYGRDVVSMSLIARIRQTPMVLESHRPYVEPTSRIHIWAFKSLRSRPLLRGVVANTSSLRDSLQTRYPDLRVAAAPNGARPVSSHALVYRDPPRPRVGYVGHLYPGKGMEIVSALAERCPWASFHVVGGNEEDLASWISRTKEIVNIVYHGFKSPADVDSYVASFDVLIAPYQWRVWGSANTPPDEPSWISPLKLPQYMAHGKPIIASDMPGIRDFLDDESALLVKPDDLDQWEDALRKLRDPKLREELGRTSYQRFNERHRSDTRARNILRTLVPDIM